MISVLIVDDDENKIRTVRRVIDETLRPEEVSVRVAGSVARAMKIMRGDGISLLIVDLNVPTRSDSPPVKDGGLRLLRRLVRPHGLKAPVHIIGLTEFGDLRAQCENEFAAESWRIVEFSWTSDEWEEPIRRKLQYILASAEGGQGVATDLAVVTALERVELEAVLALAPHWEVMRTAGDPTVYHRTTFRRGERSLRVTAAAAPEMGMAAAAALTSKVVATFRPRFVAMVGIAAGVKGKFGDIVVADCAWDYGSGKVRTVGKRRRRQFEPAPSQVPIDQSVKGKLAAFMREDEVVAKLRQEWRGQRVPRELNVIMGPFASGAAVVSSRAIINRIVRQHRKVAAVEMEVYGMLLAVQMAAMPRPAGFAIKSICDFGDHRKGDRYQRYAAYTSARFLLEFALQHLSA